MDFKVLFKKRLLSGLFTLKTVLVMQLTSIVLLTACLQVSASSYAQKVSISGKNIPLKKVFSEIREQTGYNFIYANEDLAQASDVTLHVKNTSLQKVLDICFAHQPLTYKIDRQMIVVKPKSALPVMPPAIDLIKITGRVTDSATGRPLNGVTIQVRGSTIGTTTDNEGNFSLEAPDDGVLLISYLGYNKEEVQVNGRGMINIVLSARKTGLNEVVVTALGIQREERSLGYAYAEVDGSKLKKAREINVINSLAGRVPGLIIDEGAGGPAGASRVIIRGNTSITGNNQPLYVVDGVPIDNSNYGQVGGGKYSGGYDFGDAISAINPDNIEKISVLKGASASALYGSRAANGVILITTKRGSKNKELGIEFNSTTSIEKQLTHYDGYQYIYGQGTAENLNINAAQAKTTLFNNFGPRLDPNLMAVSFDGKYRPYALVKNNIDNFFRTGATTTNTVAFSKANDNTSFRLSISDLRNRDIVPKSDMRRNTYNFTGSSKFGGKVTMNARIMYMNEKVNNRPALADDPGNIGNSFVGLANNVDQAYFKSGYKDNEGNYVDWGGGQYHLDPYWVINEMTNTTTKDRVIGGLKLNYVITDWLNIQGRASSDFTYFRFNKFSPVSTPGSLTGELNRTDQKYATTEADLLITLQKQVSPSLNLSARFGTSISKIDNTTTTFDFINQTVTDVVSANSFSDKTVTDGSYKKQINSFYGLFSAGFKDYLYIDATIRRDASSTLPENNNTYIYPSLSASFIFSDFLKMNNSILSFGKIRASAAEVGGDTDPYQLNLYYSLYPSTFNGESLGGISSTILPNKNLKPTRTSSFEAGTELKFFTDRIGFDFTYYNSKSRDQINLVPAPLSSGFSQQIINAGVVTNKGVEILLSGKPVTGKNFSWDASINFARNINTVQSLAEGVPYLVLSDARWLGLSVVAKPGSPYGAILGFGYKRDPDGNIILNPQTLTPMQADDRTVLGKGTWSWTGGITNNFQYKNFSLSALIDIKQGADIFSMTNMFAVIRGSSDITLPGRAAWIKSEEDRQTAGKSVEEWNAMGNTRGYVPQGVVQTGTDSDGKPVYTPNTKAVDPSNYWSQFYSDGNGVATPFVYDASYIKLRQVTLSYSFPASMVSRLGIKDLTIALVSRNPFIIHKNVPNVDPDSNYNNGNGQGLEYGSLPSRRSWGFNLDLKF